MKTLKLKTTPTGNGQATLTHPQALAGDTLSCITYELRNIPDDVPAHEAVRLFNLTCQVSGRVFDFSQLAPGAIVHGIAD